MFSSSSMRMWLGSTTLAGLLLASSLPALALNPTSDVGTSPRSMLLASTTVPTEITYSNVVREQLHWKASFAKNNTGKTSASQNSPSHPVAVAAQSTKAAQTTQAIKKGTRPVQLAVASQQQVSRSDNSELVEHALSLQGIPYVFGGVSRSGFDCSGYSQYVFRGSGISLPRTAAEQFRVGSSVSQGQLKSGDLVFFTTYAPGASHVGIYIGGGRFVSASNSGVSISSLGSGYYASRYLGARRVR